MSQKAKILVADDSLTIQKVVRITLSTEPYELFECLDYEDLMGKLEANPIDLLLLDFNLTNKRDGYNVLAEVVEKYPTLKIMVMLGTFDNVDDEKLNELSIQHKIIKPFESETFIKMCRELLQPTASKNIEFGSEEEDIQWIVNAPEMKSPSFPPPPKESKKPSSDALKSELQGWGIEVPGVIGQGSEGSASQIPPIEKVPLEASSGLEKPEVKVEPKKKEVKKEKGEREDFGQISLPKDIAKDEIEFETPLDVSKEIKPSPTPNKELESAIRDEMGHDEFWAVDEQVLENSFKQVGHSQTSSSKKQKSAKKSKTQEKAVIDQASIDEIKSLIEPMIRKLVENYCKDKIEQVAWEVIPDLAENIIKKEIKEISQSSTHD